MENPPIFNGKIHYKSPCSIAMLNCQRVFKALNQNISSIEWFRSIQYHTVVVSQIIYPICIYIYIQRERETYPTYIPLIVRLRKNTHKLNHNATDSQIVSPDLKLMFE